MEHEKINLKNKCNCSLELDCITEAVVLIYPDSVDVFYQHTKDQIAVSVLPVEKCLAMISTTADYLYLKKKGKKLKLKQGYNVGEYKCYEQIIVRFKNNNVTVERQEDPREKRIIQEYEEEEELYRQSKKDGEYEDNIVADLGKFEINDMPSDEQREENADNDD